MNGSECDGCGSAADSAKLRPAYASNIADGMRVNTLGAEVVFQAPQPDSPVLAGVREAVLNSLGRSAVSDMDPLLTCCPSCAAGSPCEATQRTHPETSPESPGAGDDASAAESSYPFLPLRLLCRATSSSRRILGPVGVPWETPAAYADRIFRWNDLPVSYRTMPPPDRAMLNGGMSGWMPQGELTSNGAAPPPVPRPCACDCPTPEPSPLAAPPDQDLDRRIQQAAVREVAQVLGQRPSSSPGTVAGSPPPALGLESSDPQIRDLYQRILNKLNTDAFAAQDWINEGGGGGSSSGGTPVDVMTIHRLGAALGLA